MISPLAQLSDPALLATFRAQIGMWTSAEIGTFEGPSFLNRFTSSFQETFVSLYNCFSPCRCLYCMPINGRDSQTQSQPQGYPAFDNTFQVFTTLFQGLTD
jgi:hypothetical protein